MESRLGHWRQETEQAFALQTRDVRMSAESVHGGGGGGRGRWPERLKIRISRVL